MYTFIVQTSLHGSHYPHKMCGNSSCTTQHLNDAFLKIINFLFRLILLNNIKVLIDFQSVKRCLWYYQNYFIHAHEILLPLC